MASRADLRVPSTKRKTVYADLPRSFQPDPTTGDVVLLTNEAAINQSAENLVLYEIHGTPFSDVGSKSRTMLFGLNDPVAAQVLQQSVKDAIINWDKRINIISVQTTTSGDNNDAGDINATVTYQAANIQQPQTVGIILKPVR